MGGDSPREVLLLPEAPTSNARSLGSSQRELGGVYRLPREVIVTLSGLQCGCKSEVIHIPLSSQSTVALQTAGRLLSGSVWWSRSLQTVLRDDYELQPCLNPHLQSHNLYKV